MSDLRRVRDHVDLDDPAAFDREADHRNRFRPWNDDHARGWFLAGALFPITALPSFLTWVAKFLPLTHGLALMRYGLSNDSSGLHAIWNMGDPATMAALSLAVVAAFALLLTVASIRVFARSAAR